VDPILIPGVAESDIPFDERIHIIRVLIFLLYVFELLLLFILQCFRNFLIPDIILKCSYTSLDAD
jgi:hypothetical protein